MSDNRLKKVAYNGLDRETWMENRDFLIYRQHPPGSSFLDVEALERSGRDLQREWETLEDKDLKPIPFVEIERIDF